MIRIEAAEFIHEYFSWKNSSLTVRPGGGTPIHYLYGYVPPNGVVILELLI